MPVMKTPVVHWVYRRMLEVRDACYTYSWKNYAVFLEYRNEWGKSKRLNQRYLDLEAEQDAKET